MVTALIFIAVLFVLILVHEWGHYIVAKKVGMRVDEFGIGFPPKLFGYKKGETEYTLNALPIGGFVRIYGEDPTRVDEDSERSFTNSPRWAQALVLIAGVTMNILLAWVLYAGVFMVGVPSAVDEANATDQAQLQVVNVLPDSPASEVVPRGATLTAVSVSEATLTNPTPSSLSSFVADNTNQSITVNYTLGDSEETVTLTPAQVDTDTEGEQTLLGVQTVLVEKVQYGFFAALYEAGKQTVSTLYLIVVSIGTLLYNTIVGAADFSQIAGPIGIYNLVGDAASIGIVSVLMFTAIISLNLAVINLFPFPALDGGRLLFVAVESVIRRPIDPIWTARLNLLGFIILIGLMVAVTYNDILRL